MMIGYHLSTVWVGKFAIQGNYSRVSFSVALREFFDSDGG